MQKLHFKKDEGSAFYKELKEQLDLYFTGNKIAREGSHIMRFKIFLYFGLNILFYILLLNTSTIAQFYTCYLLLGFFVGKEPQRIPSFIYQCGRQRYWCTEQPRIPDDGYAAIKMVSPISVYLWSISLPALFAQLVFVQGNFDGI